MHHEKWFRLVKGKQTKQRKTEVMSAIKPIC